MTTHIADELPRLLTGDAPRDLVLEAARHLRECEDCRQELVAAVVAHAALTSAQRFAPEIVATLAPTHAGDAEAGYAADELPDLSAVFAQVRDEAAARPHRSRVRVYTAAAVAAAVAIAGGAVALAESGSGSSAGSHSVALAPYGIGHAAASAKIDNAGRLRVDATSLPTLDSQHRYEVWLTDGGRTRMQPVGWIGTDGTAALTVPTELMQSYRDIEVSVQQIDSPSYDYSGVSVLRGSYA